MTIRPSEIPDAVKKLWKVHYLDEKGRSISYKPVSLTDALKIAKSRLWGGLVEVSIRPVQVRVKRRKKL